MNNKQGYKVMAVFYIPKNIRERESHRDIVSITYTAWEGNRVKYNKKVVSGNSLKEEIRTILLNKGQIVQVSMVN